MFWWGARQHSQGSSLPNGSADPLRFIQASLAEASHSSSLREGYRHSAALIRNQHFETSDGPARIDGNSGFTAFSFNHCRWLYIIDTSS